MPPTMNMATTATCTTCQMADDFSNYWTAVLYFKARNGSYHKVPQVPNVGFDGATGGQTVYYMQNGLADYAQKSKVTAFKPVSEISWLEPSREAAPIAASLQLAF
jgi:Domain of unknown function (DUF1996)